MGLFGDDSDQAQAYDQVNNSPHKAAVSHELIGGAAAYEAAKAWEAHQAKNGKPGTHAEAVEFLSGIAGAFVDRLAETKGLDFIDKAKAKHHAKQQLSEQLQTEY